jgi:hypothetical protein
MTNTMNKTEPCLEALQEAIFVLEERTGYDVSRLKNVLAAYATQADAPTQTQEAR